MRRPKSLRVIGLNNRQTSIVNLRLYRSRLPDSLSSISLVGREPSEMQNMQLSLFESTDTTENDANSIDKAYKELRFQTSSCFVYALCSVKVWKGC